MQITLQIYVSKSVPNSLRCLQINQHKHAFWIAQKTFGGIISLDNVWIIVLICMRIITREDV